MRERKYPDSELAHRTKQFLIETLHLSNREVGQQGNRVYLGYHGEEFVGVYNTQGERRYFSFHLENPRNNLKTALENEVMSDNAVFKRGNMWRFKKLFSKLSIQETEMSYGQDKFIPTVSLNIEILDIPLGKQGRLSGNFVKDNFYYNMVPFIQTVKNHKDGKFKNN